MKRWMWLVWIIVPVLPIGINCLMLSSVEGVEVAGTTDNWIAFWGSYAGGCVTALISFVILYRTIEYNKEEVTKRQQEAHKERLRTELSTRLARLNTKQFTVYYERLREGQDPAALCQMLEETRVQIVNDFSSFKILYTGIYDHFLSLYEAVIWRLENQLSWLSDELSQISHEQSPSRSYMVEKVKGNFDKLAAIQPQIEDFWKIASNMINK
ncbi:MAG: hypothetical protein IJ190_05950 [Prevotella sp.]|nr:hypothetical protein [Prevotella sp.]